MIIMYFDCDIYQAFHQNKYTSLPKLEYKYFNIKIILKISNNT